MRRIIRNLALLSALGATTASATSHIPVPQSRPTQELAGKAAGQHASAGNRSASSKRTILKGTQITVADAIFLGLRNNRNIKSAYIDRIQQKFDLSVTEGILDPKLAIEGEIARQRIGNVNSTILNVVPAVTLLTPAGATFSFSWNNHTHWSEAGQGRQTAAELNVEQPLLRGAGSEINLAPIRQARLGEKINRLRLKATLSETIGAIIFAHRDLLLAQEELKLADDGVSRTENLLSINRSLISSGRMAQMDAVVTEADLSTQRLRVFQAKQKIEAARLALLNLLDLDLSTPVIARESIALKKPDIKLDNLLRTAIAQRPDYQAQLYVLEQEKLGITVARNQQLWDVSLFARGRIGHETADGGPSHDFADIGGGLRFKFPVNDLSRKQQLVQANTSYRSSLLQLSDIRAGIEIQIRRSASEVDLLWQQLAVAERAHNLAARAIEIERIKLNAGRSTNFQVRSLQDNLRSSENQLLAARIGYLNSLTRLDIELGTALDTWKINLED
ncbi:TolC family protein [Brucella intermedia]|uniref:TolC family protein n=1 Tax=Brucella TaxID=234 RepID=UPI0009D7830C|nr:TolC family protein [Brucella intermedia]